MAQLLQIVLLKYNKKFKGIFHIMKKTFRKLRLLGNWLVKIILRLASDHSENYEVDLRKSPAAYLFQLTGNSMNHIA